MRGRHEARVAARLERRRAARGEVLARPHRTSESACQAGEARGQRLVGRCRHCRLGAEYERCVIRFICAAGRGASVPVERAPAFAGERRYCHMAIFSDVLRRAHGVDWLEGLRRQPLRRGPKRGGRVLHISLQPAAADLCACPERWRVSQAGYACLHSMPPEDRESHAQRFAMPQLRSATSTASLAPSRAALTLRALFPSTRRSGWSAATCVSTAMGRTKRRATLRITARECMAALLATPSCRAARSSA